MRERAEFHKDNLSALMVTYPSTHGVYESAIKEFEFVVEKDGSLTDIKTMKGIGGGCDEEACRIIGNAPKWKPGKQRGRPVRVKMVIPILFRLEEAL